MSEVIAGGAPVVEPVAAPVTEVKPAAVVVPEVPKADPLAKVIEQARLDRQAKMARETEAKEAKSQVEAMKAEMDALKRSQAFEDDPIAYGKARGWDAKTQALIGQILLYDLAPDKAPQDLRLRLFEMKQARKEQEQAKAQTEAQARQLAERNKAELEEYAGIIKNSIPSFDYSSLPESEAYWGDDHDTYHKSLLATAMNLAQTASKAGQTADLTPANVAKVLEAEIARRMSARDSRKAARLPKQADQGKKPEADKQTAVLETGSTRGLNGNGSPTPKAMTDEERLRRAIEVGFKSR